MKKKIDQEFLVNEIKYRMQLAEKYKIKDYTKGYVDACEAILKIINLPSSEDYDKLIEKRTNTKHKHYFIKGTTGDESEAECMECGEIIPILT